MRRVPVLAALGLVVILAVIVGVNKTAEASVRPTPPYGGCKEAWMVPRSEGAAICRDLGFTVRPRFVLNRHDVVVALRMRACVTEDQSGPCFWNALVKGNGRGDSFIRGGKDRVYPVRFRWLPFRSVEGHEDCQINLGPTSVVRCADGFRSTS